MAKKSTLNTCIKIFLLTKEVIESDPAKWQDIYQKSKCDLI